MDPETARKLDCGEMPDDWYSVANTEDELLSIIEELGSGYAIHGDLPFGSSFGFIVDGDDVVFFSDEFMDADEKTDNPDFQIRRFHSIADGVGSFRVNGRPVSEIGLGCRIVKYDLLPGFAILEAE